MLNRLMIACTITLLFAPLSACADHSNDTPKIKHVIYITLDGVRWQDVYQDRSHFPKLWDKYASRFTFYGLPNSKSTMEVASAPISLPSYQSQMSGAVQPCDTNECGHIKVKTLPEYLLTDLHVRKRDIAIFSSWSVIADAVESKPGTLYINVGNPPVIDPMTYRPDGEMEILNHAQLQDHPTYMPNRYDKYTFAHALHYFEKFKPRFLWISLVNADNEAHFNHRENYNQLLSYYDDALDGLISSLESLHLDESTMIIVTTDHGRGDGANWTSHGKEYPEAKQTWAFVMNGELKPMSNDGDIYHYSTLSIRPTIQAVFE